MVVQGHEQAIGKPFGLAAATRAMSETVSFSRRHAL